MKQYKLRRGDLILVILLSIGFLLSLLYPIYHLLQTDTSLAAVISQKGIVIKTIDLNLVSQPYEFTIWDASGKGYNIIEVDHGKIRVKEANCAEQIDVKAGWLRNSGNMAVCLPHQLVIELKSSTGLEADYIVR